MSRFARILAAYGAYHRDSRNRLTHYFGVPAIVYAILIALALRSYSILGVDVGLDVMVAALLVLAYLLLDVRLGLAVALLLALLIWAAEATVRIGTSTALTVAVVVFIAGWVLQLFGHHFEGNRPALLDNLLQVFVAPIYVVTELGFALGLRGELRSQVENIQGHMALPGKDGEERPMH
ncbi:MAG: Mpo1-like protein [Steroidobacteraceae bacterium]